MKLISTIFWVFISSSSLWSCSCGRLDLLDNVARSTFVARAKIISTRPTDGKEDYHDVELEIIKLYKGEAKAEVKINSFLRSSCAFLPKAGTEWLIFAQYWNDQLAFGYCSGSEQIDRTFSDRYPRALLNHTRSVNLKLQVLDALLASNLTAEDEYGLAVGPGSQALEVLKGYQNTGSHFAIFEFMVAPDMRVKSVRPLIPFTDRKLQRKVSRLMRKVKIAYKHRVARIPAAARVTVALFYYDGEDGSPSFISHFDL